MPPTDDSQHNDPSSPNRPSFSEQPPANQPPRPTLDPVGPPSDPTLPSTSSPTISPVDAAPSAVVTSPEPPSPTVVTSNWGNQEQVMTPQKRKMPKRMKLGLLIAGIVVLLGGGAAAFYFGYYMNPSVVWSQSLGNMNQGYNQLVSYINNYNSAHYQGYSLRGSFQLHEGGNSYDGSLQSAGNNKNATISAKVDLGVTKLDLEMREVAVSGSREPDIYLQLNGIKSLDSALGNTLSPQLTSLDGQWIIIDHNLLNDLESTIIQQQSQSQAAGLTMADINSLLKSIGQINQKYLFTTNSSTAVTKVIKSYGQVSINGHSADHYLVGLIPAHLQAYISDMCTTISQSNAARVTVGGAAANPSSCKQLATSAGQSNSTTFDVWADVNTRLIYQVQFKGAPNTASNLVDVGLNYKGGNSYPFFISGQDGNGPDATHYSGGITLNSDTHSLALSFDSSGGGNNATSFTSSFNVAPTDQTVSVQAPSGAEPIITVLNNLGLGAYAAVLQGNTSLQVGNIGQLSKALPNSAQGQLLGQLITYGLTSAGSSLVKD